MGTVTGKDATIAIFSGSTFKSHSVWGISDFSLTFDRGTVEQELVGETGNWFAYGSLSAEGSYTNCKFAASGNSDALSSIVDSCYITVSGTTGSNLSWYFVSAQVTGYDVTVGDADTITEASIDFVIMDPYNIVINKSTGRISDA
jgi:hypothetical protein